jgi:hypothetical protein
MKRSNSGELLSAKLYMTSRTWRVSIYSGESRCPNSSAVLVGSAPSDRGRYDHTAADIGRDRWRRHGQIRRPPRRKAEWPMDVAIYMAENRANVTRYPKQCLSGRPPRKPPAARRSLPKGMRRDSNIRVFGRRSSIGVIVTLIAKPGHGPVAWLGCR